MFKKRQPDIFNIQPDFEAEELSNINDEILFEEAFAQHPHSAQEPNRSFVGSVIQNQRFSISLGLIVFIFFIFIGKLFFLQIAHGEEYRAQAENNRTRVRIIPSQRGVLYDRNGIILAKNEPLFEVTTSKAQLPNTNNEKRNKVLNRLAFLLEKEAAQFEDILKNTTDYDEQILLETDIPYDKAMELYAHLYELQGINIELRSRRSYITNNVPSLSHIIGYTGIINEKEWETLKTQDYRSFDHIGKYGLEQFYETELRGTYGKEILEINALGHSERIVSKSDPIDGENLHISIDANLQSYIETVLTARMKGTAASRASVIMMNPTTGEIYALVSWPAYDANLFTEGIESSVYNELLQNEDLPLYARAISGEFPSGSTIKPVFAAAALVDGIIDTSTTFTSIGGISVGPWFFPDWRAGGHGTTDIYWAIADSVNTFFYMIGGGNETFTGMGIERLMEWAATFGFGSPSGIDIPGEADGFLPSKDWKLAEKGEIWYIGDTYHAAIGQGDFLTTPLQIARATAVFANNGYLVTPHFNTATQIESKQVIQEEVADIIVDAMRMSVTAGSAKSLQSVPVAVAGKTGTAQWSTTKPNHSWFTGFAPYEDPEIVITVLIEEGGDANLAVPVTNDILNWWFSNHTTLNP